MPPRCTGTGSCEDAAGPPDPGVVTGIPAGGPESAPPGRSAGEEADGLFASAGSCYDGQDNDGDDDVDCADEGCDGVASCCVGNVDCCVALGPETLPSSLPFDACPDGAPDACPAVASATAAFGSPGPALADGLLAPGGGAVGDGGLVVGAALDLTSTRVRVTATLHDAPACGSGCVEGVGIALTTQGSLEGAAVRPLVGLLLSGARDAVTLYLGDEPRQSWAVEDGSAEAWTLVAKPDGRVEVLRGDAPQALASDVFVPARGARLVLHGRNVNRPAGAGAGARIGAVALEAERCDMPTAWGPRQDVVVRTRDTREALAAGATGLGAPSLLLDGSVLRLAFERDGRLLLAGRPADDAGADFVLSHDEAQALSTADGALDDPELVARPGGGFYVFHTRRTSTGASSIERATVRLDPTEGLVLEETQTVVAGGPAGDGYEMPAVAVTGAPMVWVMLARAFREDDTSALVAFASHDAGLTFERFESPDLERLTTRGAAPRSGFDADDVGDPTIVVHDRAYHVHYAGRRGTRSSLGFLASDELYYWREVAGSTAEPVLRPGGDDAERVGLLAPDAVSSAGRMTLGYAGSDGARTTLRLTTRLAPTGAR